MGLCPLLRLQYRRRRRLLLSGGAVSSHVLRRLASSTSAASLPDTAPPLPSEEPSKPPPLSARLSFVFDQLDAMDRSRSASASARDAAFRRIQSWRRPSPPPLQPAEAPPDSPVPSLVSVPSEPLPSPPQLQPVSRIPTPAQTPASGRTVDIVHPWPEWIELIERLTNQRYFDAKRIEEAEEEERIAAEVSIDLSSVEEAQFDFTRDWAAVRTAFMNFGHDRFDILKSLSRKDLQILVGFGCPSTDSRLVFSSKLLRKHVHLDEGDVCSSCNLRNSCSRGYILTKKEEEAQTHDVMRILLAYGFDHINGTVENKSLLKMNNVKTVVRKLINEIVKLSAVPIDPNLPRPVIKKPPPKVKQPPPTPKRRVGRDDIEMKKGDWLCPKCDFMNFAKNLVCLQCDSKRPKRHLLPGEWECPGCNFLNYRRNMACFHCEHKRPPDEYTEQQMEVNNPRDHYRIDIAAHSSDVSNAWNFDFDDNASDGADVAAFEFADLPARGRSSSLDNLSDRSTTSKIEDIGGDNLKNSKQRGRRLAESRSRTDHSCQTGFDDFADEEDDNVDSYELDMSTGGQTSGVSRRSFYEFDRNSDSDDERSSRRTIDHQNYSDVNDDMDDLSLRSTSAETFREKNKGNYNTNQHRKKTSFHLESDGELLSDSDAVLYGGPSSSRRSMQRNPGRNSRRNQIISGSDDEPHSDVGSDVDYGKSDDWRKLSGNMRGSYSNGGHHRGGSRVMPTRKRGSKHFTRFDGDSPSGTGSNDDFFKSNRKHKSFDSSSDFSSRGRGFNGRSDDYNGLNMSTRATRGKRFSDNKQHSDKQWDRTNEHVGRFGSRDRKDRLERGGERFGSRDRKDRLERGGERFGSRDQKDRLERGGERHTYKSDNRSARPRNFNKGLENKRFGRSY